MKIGAFARSRTTQEQPVESQPKPPSHNAAIAAVVVLLLIGAFIFFTPQGQGVLNQGLQLFSHLGGPSSNGTTYSVITTNLSVPCPSGSSITSLVAPDINGSRASIWYPLDYCTLANYALGLINQDRTANGTSPVTLDFAPAAQQHVDSMLYYGYFSHNDTQGYKPYMRYSLLGGRGADFENVATVYNSQFGSTRDVEAAIKDLENSMMNDDVNCCANLHRYNILSPLHNQVSIGIAYNATAVYFGEEFENNYIAMSFSPSGGCKLSASCQVVMTGTPIDFGVTSSAFAVLVTYDGTPSPATAAQLNAGAREYDPGLVIGGVFPPCNPFLPPGCNAFQSGITVHADTWTTNSKSTFDIEFSLHDFIYGQGSNPGYGAGVYNIYVVTALNTNDALTSISVFVT
jgi:uncharacterized protein YkwD